MRTAVVLPVGLLLLFGGCSPRMKRVKPSPQAGSQAIPQEALLTEEKMTAFDWLNSNQHQGADIATYIWHHPELGLGEHKSSAILQDYLTQTGFDLEVSVAGMGIAWVASLGRGKPVIGIHAPDIALLPRQQTWRASSACRITPQERLCPRGRPRVIDSAE